MTVDLGKFKDKIARTPRSGWLLPPRKTGSEGAAPGLGEDQWAFLAATPLSESDISAASGVCRTAGLRIAGFDERIISTEIAPFAGQRGSSRNVVGRTSARAIDCA